MEKETRSYNLRKAISIVSLVFLLLLISVFLFSSLAFAGDGTTIRSCNPDFTPVTSDEEDDENTLKILALKGTYESSGYEMTLEDAQALIDTAAGQNSEIAYLFTVFMPKEELIKYLSLYKVTEIESHFNLNEWRWVKTYTHEDAAESAISDAEIYGTFADSLVYGESSFAKIGLTVTKSLALVILIVLSLIRLIRCVKVTDEFSSQELLRVGISFLVGLLLIAYSDAFMETIEKIGVWFFEQLTYSVLTNITTTGTSIESIGTDLSVNIVFQILMYFTYFAIIAAGYGLLFELALRRLLIPIALTDLASEGTRSPGYRYIKTYLGIYIRIAMYILICVLGASVVQIAHETELFTVPLGYLGVDLSVRAAEKALISTSSDAVREAMVNG